MKLLEKYLELLFLNVENNKNIKISKKIKYGFSHYAIELDVQVKNEPVQSWNHLSVNIDNRNNCIEIIGHHIPDQIVIEDTELVKKWSKRCENYLQSKLNSEVETVIVDILSSSLDKSLLRQYQMDKLFNNDTI